MENFEEKKMTEGIYNYGDELKECAVWWEDFLKKVFERVKKGEVATRLCSSGYGHPDNGTSSYGCRLDTEDFRIRFEGLFHGDDWEIVKFTIKKKTSLFLAVFGMSYYKRIINFNQDYDRFPKEFCGINGICDEIYRYVEKKKEADKRCVLLKKACPYKF